MSNRKPARWVVAAVAGATIVGVAPTAWACSCVQPPPPAQALADASRVFEGDVTAVSQPQPGRVAATFRVVRAWKGVNEPELVVLTAGNSAACGLDFAQGQRWLVYTHLYENETHANLCSRSTQNGNDDIAALGAATYTPPAETTGAPPSTPPPSTPPPSTSPAPAPGAAPAQGGGCAGCAVGEGPSSVGPWWLVLVALWRRSRRPTEKE
jgi:MYXO-CTERM domain-containing protein